ncbi:MAG: hypothetical protein Q9221_001852 [Calogaya cf. arnoldii]
MPCNSFDRTERAQGLFSGGDFANRGNENASMARPSSVGEILVFLNLAKYIVDRPVYALRARGFEEGETYSKNIPEIIQTYHDAIKVKQPSGPYTIAGYSYGAMIAFNITKALKNHGDQVPFLGIFNLPPHIQFRMRQLDWTKVILNFTYFPDLITQDHAHKVSPDMHKLSNDAVLDCLISKTPRSAWKKWLWTKQFTNWADLAHCMHSGNKQ